MNVNQAASQLIIQLENLQQSYFDLLKEDDTLKLYKFLDINQKNEMINALVLDQDSWNKIANVS